MKALDWCLCLTYLAMACAVAFFDWTPNADGVAFAAFMGTGLAFHLKARME